MVFSISAACRRIDVNDLDNTPFCSHRQRLVSAMESDKKTDYLGSLRIRPKPDDFGRILVFGRRMLIISELAIVLLFIDFYHHQPDLYSVDGRKRLAKKIRTPVFRI